MTVGNSPVSYNAERVGGLAEVPDAIAKSDPSTTSGSHGQSERSTRADIVAEARSWLGTPWQHQQQLRGVAVDCGQLVLAVGKACGLLPADLVMEGYGRTPDGTLLQVCDQHLDRISEAQLQPGDVVVVAMIDDPQHLGIVGDYRHGVGKLSLIHASSVAGRVIETRLMFARGNLFRAAYRFRGVA